MKAQIFKPGPVLSKYIDNFMLVDIDWKNTASMSSIWRLIPYGKISMLLVYGDPHEYSLFGPDQAMEKTLPAFMVGQLTQPVWLKFSGHTRLIKIQFKSAGARQILPLNMDEFKNVPSLDLEAIWGSHTNDLLSQIHGAATDEERIGKLEAFLIKRLLPQQSYTDYIEYTVGQLHQHQGGVSISALEQKLGISTRQLERLFRHKVGLSPKEMSKLIRLNSAFTHLGANPEMSITSLSYEAGYYDQAHFSRDFTKITGVRPSKLFSQKSDELFVTHGKCFMSPLAPVV